MIKHKINGFLTALILAVVSFFVIIVFCPDFSNKYLGVSLRKNTGAVEKVEKFTEDAVNEIVDISTLLKK